MAVTRKTVPFCCKCPYGEEYITPAISIRVKAGRGIANGRAEDDGWYQTVVDTKVYKVRDSSSENSLAGTWSSVRTIDHPGDPVVSNSIDVEFTDETVNDTSPESPLYIAELDEDAVSYVKTSPISLQSLKDFAGANMHEEWVSYGVGSEVAPSVVGTSGRYVSPSEGRVEVMVGQYAVQASFSGPGPHRVTNGTPLDVGVVLLHGESEVHETKTLTWQDFGWFTNDPENLQGGSGWYPIGEGGDNEFFDVSVYDFSVNAFPASY